MTTIEPLDPARYRRLPWKNGRGELVLIDGDGVQRWNGNYPSMWLDPQELLDEVTTRLQ